jgi:hypothetical protein
MHVHQGEPIQLPLTSIMHNISTSSFVKSQYKYVYMMYFPLHLVILCTMIRYHIIISHSSLSSLSIAPHQFFSQYDMHTTIYDTLIIANLTSLLHASR